MEVEEWLARPLSEVLKNTASSIAQAQMELDKNSIEIQREIKNAIEKGQLDYEIQAPWYRFSEIKLELKLAISLEGKKEVDREGNLRAFKPVIAAYPVNARFKNTYDFEVEGASVLRLNIVSIPPPE